MRHHGVVGGGKWGMVDDIAETVWLIVELKENISVFILSKCWLFSISLDAKTIKINIMNILLCKIIKKKIQPNYLFALWPKGHGCIIIIIYFMLCFFLFRYFFFLCKVAQHKILNYLCSHPLLKNVRYNI